MGLLKKLKTISKGNYEVFCSCPNCGFGTTVKVPKGTSVKDFVKGGMCKCDDCDVVFYPKEYTTGHFEKKSKLKSGLNINIKNPKNKKDVFIPKKHGKVFPKTIKW